MNWYAVRESNPPFLPLSIYTLSSYDWLIHPHTHSNSPPLSTLGGVCNSLVFLIPLQLPIYFTVTLMIRPVAEQEDTITANDMNMITDCSFGFYGLHLKWESQMRRVRSAEEEEMKNKNKIETKHAKTSASTSFTMISLILTGVKYLIFTNNIACRCFGGTSRHRTFTERLLYIFPVAETSRWVA